MMRRQHPLLTTPALLSFAFALALAPLPALGQDDDDDDDGDDGDDTEEVEEATAAAELLGGSDQTIYVIQSKPRLVKGSFEFSPQFAQSVNDRFTSHTGLLLSGLYHLQENVAFELSVGGFFWWDDPFGANDRGPRLGGRDTDMTVEIRQKERLAPELVQLYRLTWMANANLQWSPIYGKVAVHGVQLGQFNLYLSVGAGVTGLQLENQQALGEYYALSGPLGPDVGPMALTTSFGGGLRFYFGDHFGIRFEIRDYVNALSVMQSEVSSEPFSTFDVSNTVLAQVGVSFIF
jgi:outer membrane beta-barrel protein